ncbi:MAG TPA: protein-methionine-sulfoxide reductase catalytic subunit MsrP [Anaerolineaceae bacterium]|uniref:Protein-methionine-sulfoxide reductase catalytic subunit MsrP n=1 Tax=Anaerolinea thermophila TaxID=167964 RepID=A0A101FZA5_9CHLR|nr:MAG: Sulfoxide reductase catalytic subunit YedY [Anaerolinea thermophila]HAF61091.1 protein-methionine-sulfoxide reductase catalytic subunit MsrP [Anaerolineaceae bacterium]
MMVEKKKPDEITPQELYQSRRTFLKTSLTITSAAALLAACKPTAVETIPTAAAIPSELVDELGSSATLEEDITGFTNYYEFSSNKLKPTELAQDFITSPWTVQIGGLVENPQEILVEELIARYSTVERVYRMRCVEGWSMVIPWQGFLLKDLVEDVKPTKDAVYVRFEGTFDPEQMPGQQYSTYPWPYVEGLRLDEAMHDLTLLATGIYGKDLTPQNGAPIRLVVPWKYGFKSIKAIRKIDFVEEMPTSLWMALSSREYGFYANVNPNVPHPRWSQASEQRIGESGRRDTLMFNGYEQEVQDLYTGMDLTVNF